MRKSTLGAIALGVGGAAVAGYGASIGRDAWRMTKKDSVGLLVLAVAGCVVVLPFLGARNLFRGYSENKMGFGIGYLLVGGLAAFGLFSLVPETAPWLLGGYVASSGVGVAVGLMQRPARRRTFAILEQNEDFLERLGFTETGEAEISHLDGDGNPLRFVERTSEALVFFAVGRRNKRAYISLTDEGRMVGYTGVISLDQPRIFHAA